MYFDLSFDCARSVPNQLLQLPLTDLDQASFFWAVVTSTVPVVEEGNRAFRLGQHATRALTSSVQEATMQILQLDGSNMLRF